MKTYIPIDKAAQTMGRLAACPTCGFEAHSRDNPEMYDRIMRADSATASRLGRLGGKAKSAAKAATSRANGAKGGRPRKIHPDQHELISG